MNKILKYIGFALLLLQFNCTDDFDEINTDPTAITGETFNANYLLSQAQYSYSNTGYAQLLFESMWIQGLASTFGYYFNGDKYVASSSLTSYINTPFNNDYRAASLVYEMKNLAAENEDLSNLYHVGTLMKVMILQRATDSYGDIPYSEALQAKAGISQPAYDTQASIYNTMLAELDTAVTSLDVSKAGPTADLFYGGDVAKWQRFGYSLMLKVAMRLSKVDPTTAQAWAERAAAGGTFESYEDNAVVFADNSTGFGNGTSSALRTADDYREVRWSKTFIDYLKATNDPRLGVIAEVSQAGYENNSNQDLAGDSDPAVQIGLPNGYTLATIVNHPEYPGASGSGDDAAIVGNYSRPTTAIYLDRSGPSFIYTYSESELLLAEAAARGWNVGGTAAQHYANGVAAAMRSLGQYGEAGAIDEATIAAYVAAHPLDEANAIAQINQEYWVTDCSLFNFIEAWINWKRSGYPQLTPVTFANQFSPGAIPRRIPYQTTESSNNPDNYNEAVSRLNDGDSFTSRVWWDVN